MGLGMPADIINLFKEREVAWSRYFEKFSDTNINKHGFVTGVKKMILIFERLHFKDLPPNY